ncbi:transposase [Janibacter corallicola]|uniref:transposase n=1 Tax=Janibacter corallicola TaxID=415212 RepID=UPI000A6A585D
MIRKPLRARGITAHILEPEDQKGHRLRRGSAGGRLPNVDPDAYRGRNVVERRYSRIKQWRARDPL